MPATRAPCFSDSAVFASVARVRQKGAMSGTPRSNSPIPSEPGESQSALVDLATEVQQSGAPKVTKPLVLT